MSFAYKFGNIVILMGLINSQQGHDSGELIYFLSNNLRPPGELTTQGWSPWHSQFKKKLGKHEVYVFDHSLFD